METIQAVEQSITEALSTCSSQPIKQLGKHRWQLFFANENTLQGIASVDEDWLTVEVLTPGIRKRTFRPEQLRKCLDMNPTLSAGIKYCIRPHELCPKIRYEGPLEEETCSSETLRFACSRLSAAYHRLYGKSDDSSTFVSPATQDMAETNYNSLEDICHSAGWSFTRRASGPLSVELEIPGDSYQATVEYRTLGLGVSVRLTTFETLNDASLHALALVLLITGGLVRRVRPYAIHEGGRTGVGYEVLMNSSTPSENHLCCGLSALSVACRICGRHEISAIQNESIAKRYLSGRGLACDNKQVHG